LFFEKIIWIGKLLAKESGEKPNLIKLEMRKGILLKYQ
jgi:hypothetical protein